MYGDIDRSRIWNRKDREDRKETAWFGIHIPDRFAGAQRCALQPLRG
jgi:hypothetical protein